jgi:hypothetical protein
MTPGTYPSLTMGEYLALPAVSASIIRAMVDRCPAAARHESWLNPGRERDTSDAMDAGSIAHEILLEGSDDCCAVIDPNDHPAKTTGAIPEGWTNASIRAARDSARAAGKIPVLPKDMAEICAMVDAAHGYIETLRESEPAIWRAFQPDGGESEVTMVWQDGETPCRLRTDRVSTDRRIVVDAKFTATSAEPDSWGRSQLMRMGYFVSAAFYRRGIRALHGVDASYYFLVIESVPPYLCSLIGVDPAWLALGDSKVSYGLRSWQACMRADRWPAYPARACYPELPQWADADWMEKQTDNPFGIPYDVSKLFRKTEAA